MKINPISVIGMGAVSAAGIGVAKGFEAVLNGMDCLSPLSLFESNLKEIPLCGQIKEKLKYGPNEVAPNRSTAIALHAVNEALQPAMDRGSLRLGIVLATTVAGMTDSEIFYKDIRNDPKKLKNARSALAYHEPTSITGKIASSVNAHGFLTISTACSTSLHALGIAKRLIEDNTYDLCLAVGVDALSILTLRGFASLMLIDYSGCKPFDKRRIGISLGEGAGVLLLASEKARKQLNTKSIASISGWGASADCYHMTAPHPNGEGAINAIKSALEEGQINSEEISMIAAHGTATPDNDISEIKAIRSLFNPLPPFYSLKRTIGHTLAASGTLEAVYSICALNENIIPKTAGFELFDDSIKAKPSEKTKKPLKHILKNAFGFGGNNAAVIISKTD